MMIDPESRVPEEPQILFPEDPARFALPFDPVSLLEEARESSSLEGLDKYNDTNVVEFILAADAATLYDISYFCMEDPRLWEAYWEVIYDSAQEIKIRKEAAATAAKEEKVD